MANFDYDVFISYAHIDNATLRKGQEGWVDTLHRALELRLAQLLGDQPRIWRDEKLAGNDRFDDEIVSQLLKAAALVAVLSPRYVRSDWCTKEVEAFRQAAEKTIGETVANKSRIFKVVKTPVPIEEHPPVVQNLLGYTFFEDDGRNPPREFVRGFGRDPEPEYWDKLDDLAYALRDLICLLKTGVAAASGAASAQPAHAVAPATTRATVYLAEATSELDAERNQIRRELLDHGHSVVPDQPLPLRGSSLDGVIENYLERSSLSIHLFGTSYGIVPEGHALSLAELQARLAAERSRAGGFSRLAWILPGAEIADERQKNAIDGLRNDPNLGAADSVLETGLDELKNEIGDRLRSATERTSVVTASTDRPAKIYLVFDQADVDAVGPLEDYLCDLGFAVSVPLFDGDAATVVEEHHNSLYRCHAVMIYQGEATDAWLRTKLRDLRKAPASRAAPLDAKAILLAAPVTPQKARYSSREVDHVFKCFEDLDIDALAPFIARLSRRREQS